MLFIADLHLNRFSDSVPVEYPSQVGGGLKIPSRMACTLNRCREVINHAAQTKQSLVMCGDVFDSSRPPLWVVAYFLEMLEYASSVGVTVYIIPGNHDCDVTWGLELIGTSGHGNVVYIGEPTVLSTEVGRVGFVPHMPRMRVEEINHDGTFEGYCNSVIGEQVDILVSHAHLDGVKNSSDVEIEAGEAIHFNPKLYPAYQYAILGHIHKAQVIGNVWYPGSVSPCDYSEAEDVKGYVQILSPKEGPVFLEFSHVGKQYKHIKIDLMNKDTVEFPPDKVRALVGGKLVKVTVYANDPLKVNEWEIRKALNEFGFVTRFEVVLNREESETGLDEEEVVTVSYHTLLENWLKNKEGISEELRDGAMDAGRVLIDRVLSRRAE